MKNNKEHLDTISEIRDLIERSSKFRSLGGTSGIAVGITAIAGVLALSFYLKAGLFEQVKDIMTISGSSRSENIPFIIATALVVFFVSLAVAVFFTSRNARKKNIVFWEGPARRVFMNFFIFLLSGGIFCIILLYYGIYLLIVPSMLIFYGLALVNVSKFTFNEIAQLGIIEICLGIVAAFIPVYPLLMWLIGFGILHLVYGFFVFIKYEKAEA